LLRSQTGSGGFTSGKEGIEFTEGSDRITGMIDYDDDKVNNPFAEFTEDNIGNFKFVPFSDKNGSTVFSEDKLKRLMSSGTANLKGLDDRFKFPFGVQIDYKKYKPDKDGNKFAGYYTMKRVGGQVQSVTVNVGGEIDEIDDQLMHELQHIQTAWKSGKLYQTNQTSTETHDKDKNEQIAMTNDIIGELEHRYRNGESLDVLEKETQKTISDNIKDKPYIAAQNQKALILFKQYLENYKIAQGVKQTSDNRYYDQVNTILKRGVSPRDARRYLELTYRSLIKNRASATESDKVREAMQKFDKLQ